MDRVRPALGGAGQIPNRRSVRLVLRLWGPSTRLAHLPDRVLAGVPAASLRSAEEMLVDGRHLEGLKIDALKLCPPADIGHQTVQELNLGLVIALRVDDRRFNPKELHATVSDQLMRQPHDIGETKIMGLPFPKITGEELRCLPWFPKANTSLGGNIQTGDDQFIAPAISSAWSLALSNMS